MAFERVVRLMGSALMQLGVWKIRVKKRLGNFEGIRWVMFSLN